jgi:hypothetical protein
VAGRPGGKRAVEQFGALPPVIDAGSRALLHGSGAIMSGHDLAVLVGWIAGGLLVSFWVFAWDPHRPAHARQAEARTTARSA